VRGGLTGRNYSHRQFCRASVEYFVTNIVRLPVKQTELYSDE